MLGAVALVMSAPTPVTMDDGERDEFLGNGGTGVLALDTPDGPPHALPVSYGYDAPEETFYFRLAVGSGREKGEVAGRPVTFVVHGEEGGWRSVVASGQLEPVEDADIATDTLDGLSRVQIPLVDIFGRPPGEVSFEFHRLVPESLTGRRESSTAP